MGKKSKATRRVEIVKDAMKQIELGVIVSKPGTYVNLNENKIGIDFWPSMDSGKTATNREDSAKEYLLKADKPATCECCAKGTLLIACVRQENKFTLDELTESNDNTEVMERLTQDGLFSRRNLDLVERVYEYWPRKCRDNDWIAKTDEYTAGIIKFGKKYGKGSGRKHSTARLLAIFRNMIRNEGVFVLK